MIENLTENVSNMGYTNWEDDYSALMTATLEDRSGRSLINFKNKFIFLTGGLGFDPLS